MKKGIDEEKDLGFRKKNENILSVLMGIILFFGIIYLVIGIKITGFNSTCNNYTTQYEIIYENGDIDTIDCYNRLRLNKKGCMHIKTEKDGYPERICGVIYIEELTNQIKQIKNRQKHKK